MKKEMEEELARSLEQNRQEVTNMEMSWQQRLQESEKKIANVRAHPPGGHCVILMLHYRGNKRRRREKRLVKLFLIFGTSMRTLSLLV